MVDAGASPRAPGRRGAPRAGRALEAPPGRPRGRRSQSDLPIAARRTGGFGPSASAAPGRRRSPRAIRKRSRAPRDVAAVLEREEALGVQLAGPAEQLLVPLVRALTVSSASELAGGLGNRDRGVGLLVGVDSDYDHLVPFRLQCRRADRRRTCLGGGFIAKLLSGHAGVPRRRRATERNPVSPEATAQYRVSPPPRRGYAGRSTSSAASVGGDPGTNRAVSRVGAGLSAGRGACLARSGAKYLGAEGGVRRTPITSSPTKLRSGV